MEKNNQNMDINSKISLVLSKIIDEKTYSFIMQELFCYEIGKPLKFIDSLNILPKLNVQQLQNNFRKNIQKIISEIKNIIKTPYDDIYKVLSCIYGAFLGDAIGAFCEFEEPNKNNSKYIFRTDNTVIGGAPGQVTDDSEMALSLAYAIMDNPIKDQLMPDYIYFYYGAWFNTQPLDFGNTTKNALELFDFFKFNPNLNNFKVIEPVINTSNNQSLSNGFLMRKCTFIAWLYYRFYNEINTVFNVIDNHNNNIALLNLYKKIKNLSYADNKCTNPNYLTNTISSIYSLMALMAIKGKDSHYILNNIVNLVKNPNFINIGKDEQFIYKEILYYINLFSKKPDLYKIFGDISSQESVFNNMGFCLHSFKLTLYFLYNFDNIGHNNKYRTIMEQICDLGGDTDTNCCIVGAVIGPLIGMGNFGNEFNKMIELIPPNRAIYSVSMILLFIIYLKKSNKDENLVKDDKYFLKQILTMLYGNVDTNLI